MTAPPHCDEDAASAVSTVLAVMFIVLSSVVAAYEDLADRPVGGSALAAAW